MKCETCYDVWFGDDGADKKEMGGAKEVKHFNGSE